jgi:hypothetical protein
VLPVPSSPSWSVASSLSALASAGTEKVTKLDAVTFTGSNSTPAEMAAICRGQAALLRESAAMQEEMAELHDRLGDYFEGEAGRD